MTSSRALVNSIALLALSLFALTGCSREKGDWRSAQAADSPESYQQFIDEHPESTYVASARERLQQLAEEKDWRAAAEADSAEAYQQFIAQYPSGKWAKEARVRIDAFSSQGGAAASTIPAAPDPSSSSAASPAPADAPAAAPAIVASGFGVQLGAFSSAERANEEWKKLQGDAAGMLDGLAPRVVVGESSGKTIYRLQAEVRDEAQARAICGGLKVAKKPCVPVIPH
jgi:cell division septation protein DedD